MLNIKDIIKDIGIEDKRTFLYGRYKAKIKSFDNLLILAIELIPKILKYFSTLNYFNLK